MRGLQAFYLFFRNEFNKFNRKYLKKKIYDEVKENMFDMSNMRN